MISNSLKRNLSLLFVLFFSSILLSNCTTTKTLVNFYDPEAWRHFYYEHNKDNLEQKLPADHPQRDIGKGRTVLLIPGMTLGSEFFELMAERLRKDGFKPVLYHDPDLLAVSLELAAERLGEKVTEVINETGEDKILLVGECVGGVTSRYYMQVLGGKDKVDYFVSFVSPHNGSTGAGPGAFFTRWGGLKDLNPKSNFMTTMNKAEKLSSSQFTSIYSCRDILVNPDTRAIVDGATNVEFCDHKIGHFTGFWDELVYERILLSLQGKTESSPILY